MTNKRQKPQDNVRIVGFFVILIIVGVITFLVNQPLTTTPTPAPLTQSSPPTIDTSNIAPAPAPQPDTDPECDDPNNTTMWCQAVRESKKTDTQRLDDSIKSLAPYVNTYSSQNNLGQVAPQTTDGN